MVKAPLTTRFLYDGIDLIAESDGAGAVQRRYVHGPGIDDPIVWYEGAVVSNATRRFLMADERGSVLSVSDSAGAVLGLNAYDEYGNPAPGNLGRFGYTGQAWLAEAGLWHYKARMYAPALGRFMQTDPIGYAEGLNWYDYVGGDPVNFTDPLGLQIVVTGVSCRKDPTQAACLPLLVVAQDNRGRREGGAGGDRGRTGEREKDEELVIPCESVLCIKPKPPCDVPVPFKCPGDNREPAPPPKPLTPCQARQIAEFGAGFLGAVSSFIPHPIARGISLSASVLNVTFGAANREC